MHDSVRDVWVAFNEPLEGKLRFMYADVLGLVTTGMGNLIDPIGAAIGLPWKSMQNTPAQKTAVLRAWNAVKNDPNCARLGWVYAKTLPDNNLHLSDEDVDALIEDKLRGNDRQFASRFGDWERRPADAQLAVHSMGWAMGPAFWGKFPRFTKAFEAADYNTCAAECRMQPEHGTLITRNRRNALCLLNAALAVDSGSDVSALTWSATGT